jgi:hypothetical protein
MKFRIPETVTRTVASTVLKAEQNSPTLLFGAGIVLGVATVVTASRSTLKLQGVLNDAKQDKADSNRLFLEHSEGARSDYPVTSHRQDMAHIYIRTAARVTKLYGPSLFLGIASVACLTQSHRILTSRNAALTAAYTAVDRAFREYRGRVSDELGEEREREIYYNVEKCDVDVDDGKGGTKKKKVKKAGGTSMYKRLFGPSNANWNPNAEYNLAFLRLVQNQLNDKLRAHGHLMLNDAYDALGMSRTPAGTQVGWLWQKGTGDNVVDFGIWTNSQMEGTLDFLIGFEDEILLDFNVDGPIWKSI